MPFYAPPTREQIVELLQAMPALPGLNLVDYADIISVIPGSAKVPGTQKEYRDTWTLYFDVAARVLMARKWHYEQGEGGKNGEQYEVVSVEPGVESSPDPDKFYTTRVTLKSPSLGIAIGYATADISTSGARADKTNPVENSITSAFGRALGLDWGFGLLPGTGAVASADEMVIAMERKAAAVEPKRGQRKQTTSQPKAAPVDGDGAEDDFAEEPGDEASQIVELARAASIVKLRETATEAFGEEKADERLLAAYLKLTGKDTAPVPDEWTTEEIARLSRLLKKHINDNKGDAPDA